MSERFRSLAEVDAELARLRAMGEAERERLRAALRDASDPAFRRTLLRNGLLHAVGEVKWLRAIGTLLLPKGRQGFGLHAGDGDGRPATGGMAQVLSLASVALLAGFLTPERLERLGLLVGRRLRGLPRRWRERRARRADA